MKILLQGRIAVDHLDLFKEFMDDDWIVSTWDPELQDEALFRQLASDADVIVGGNSPFNQWPATPALKLVQIPWAGYNFTSPTQMPDGVAVANCYEHETAMAEYVMLAMLEWQIRLCDMDARFRREGWGGKLPAGGIFHHEVRGQTLGIIGYGHIGKAVATRAQSFDMTVLATRRQKQDKPAELDWLGNQEQLPELLERSDFILVACDLNEQTENLINTDTIKQMKPGAVVINVSRGEVVNEADLFHALKEKRLGGAVLDVWYNYNQAGEPEVWPGNFPFQELDNVLLSAHESAWTGAQDRRRWQVVVENVRRVQQEKEPQNVVFTGSA